MCPSASVPPPADIEFHCTDEELVDHVEKMVCGSPLPANVITEVNPYNVLPWNLPGDPKATGTGYWKPIGEGRRIPRKATTTGCRTTLEFYIGKDSYVTKTDWMMYEYKIYRKRLSEKNEELDSSSLCMVFLNSIQSPDNEESHSSAGRDHVDPMSAIRVYTEENCLSAQDDSSGSQVIHGIDKDGSAAVSEQRPPYQIPDDPVHDLDGNYDFSRGDFLELHDLVNPGSPSSSSENSSCLSLSSDEYFDSIALLRDLEDLKGENTQKNQTNSNFSVSTSHRVYQMVFKPTSSGSAVQQHILDIKKQKHVANQHPSTSLANDAASSGGKRKAIGMMVKLRKKYWCFMPF